jgi:hypothetical protein
MLIFRRIFLSNYWWQKSDICSQASYRYPILWEAFFDPSDSYFLFAEERGYHRWVLAHSSSCYIYSIVIPFVDIGFLFFFYISMSALLMKTIYVSLPLLHGIFPKIWKNVVEIYVLASKMTYNFLFIPPRNGVVGGVYWFHHVRPSVDKSYVVR